MNCEEKLEEAKRLYESANDDQKYVLEDLFPELKDSEDEKIKNQIISFLEGFERDHYKSPYFSSWITWLKKQGEQKTNNNFEPKFKVGDWIIGGIHDKPTQITKIEKEGYVIDRGWIGSSFAEDMHLWTLQDAKDGDVLVSKYSQPFIYNGNYNLFHVGSYCGLSTSDKFIVSTSKCFWTGNVNIRPAIKEKCDLLFKRMEEAGYEWDADKKELKKIEPKFKVGDWIVYREDIWKIGNIALENYYELLKTNNEVATRSIKEVDENAHLWTIKDAKYGDVLVHNDCAFIFVGLEGNIVRALAKTLFDGIIPIYFGEIDENNDYHPATKEQRELLFKEMKEAGYEWDSEKKELKKINTFCQENCKGFQETGKCFADGECKAKKEAEQKSTWSEEDEIGLGDALWCCKQAASIANDENDMGNVWFAEQWLKSLKDRVQPQQEWSEEDEERIKNILSVLGVQVCWNGATGKKGNPYQKEIDWLKSLNHKIIGNLLRNN